MLGVQNVLKISGVGSIGMSMVPRSGIVIDGSLVKVGFCLFEVSSHPMLARPMSINKNTLWSGRGGRASELSAMCRDVMVHSIEQGVACCGIKVPKRAKHQTHDSGR